MTARDHVRRAALAALATRYEAAAAHAAIAEIKWKIEQHDSAVDLGPR